jgi:hypothetical protein
LDPGRAAGPAGRPAAVDIAGAAPIEPMETTRPVDHATSPTSVLEHGGAGSGSQPCETAACSAAAGCRVDRLRPDKPGRLHRSTPQARTAGQAGIGRGVSPRPRGAIRLARCDRARRPQAGQSTRSRSTLSRVVNNRRKEGSCGSPRSHRHRRPGSWSRHRAAAGHAQPCGGRQAHPRGRPGRRVEQGAGRQRKLHRVANAQAHRGSAVANPIGDRNIPVAGSLCHLGPLIEDSRTTRSRPVPEPPVT